MLLYSNELKKQHLPENVKTIIAKIYARAAKKNVSFNDFTEKMPVPIAVYVDLKDDSTVTLSLLDCIARHFKIVYGLICITNNYKKETFDSNAKNKWLLSFLIGKE